MVKDRFAWKTTNKKGSTGWSLRISLNCRAFFAGLPDSDLPRRRRICLLLPLIAPVGFLALTWRKISFYFLFSYNYVS